MFLMSEFIVFTFKNYNYDMVSETVKETVV